MIEGPFKVWPFPVLNALFGGPKWKDVVTVTSGAPPNLSSNKLIVLSTASPFALRTTKPLLLHLDIYDTNGKIADSLDGTIRTGRSIQFGARDIQNIEGKGISKFVYGITEVLSSEPDIDKG